MIELLDRILNKLGESADALKFWHVLGEDEIGIVQRIGMYNRDLSPGFNWKWPLIELPNFTSAALDSTELSAQTLTTSDGKQVTLRGILTYKVINARKFLLECEDAESVVNDVGACVVAEVVPCFSLSDVLKDEDFSRELRKRMRARAKRWGVYVESFGLADRVSARVYRLISSEVS